MRHFYALLCFCMLSLLCKPALADKGRVHILPEPVSVMEGDGAFSLSNNVSIAIHAADTSLNAPVAVFIHHIYLQSGITLHTAKSGSKRIDIYIDEKPNANGTEAYTLSVKPGGITLHAGTAGGAFYGLQTLLQLMTVDGDKRATASVAIPCVEVTDYPRFGWRGLMLDVSRHFFTKDEVLKYIDEMAAFKFNTLHLHLADDNGWRVEIKSLPQLTRVGAYRVKRTGRWGTFAAPEWAEPATDGGFYTQDDIHEMLQYAAVRNITILPEIDIPAHSLALIASYPNLSCSQMTYFVNPGSDFYMKDDNVLCPGNDSVYVMLDKIFTELAQLFPNPYIHIGGDEAYKGFWEKCPKCQKRMADEHLKNTDELQSYFVKRIEQILKSKGKKMIGWDEILEGGLAPEATVMSWRGMEGGIKAAKMNHHVVMSPWGFCYIDLYQGDPNVEPATYGKLLLKTSYSFEPVPDSIDASYILGGQANLWSESVPTFHHAEYMTWPRSVAIAEVLWSPKGSRNWDGFISSLEAQFKRFDAEGVNYSKAVYDAVITSKKGEEDSVFIKIASEITSADIYYTFDETNVDNYSHKYDGSALTFPLGANEIKVITYKDGKPIGKQITVTKKQLEERANDRPDW